MKDSGDITTGAHTGRQGQKPALQVICLGSGGGPSEENVTAFLVRSVGSAWAKGSLLAVDAGSHFAPITRILERDFPSVSRDRRRTRSSKRQGYRGDVMDQDVQEGMSHSSSPSSEDENPPMPEPTTLKSGPFSGLTLPNESARANALHLIRTYVSTYLITHPHLDHISGFAINTAAFHATSRPKTLAALPSTVDAMKRHIFNDVIWPNLTDEDGGVGFVTFQRLKEGGDVMLGEGEGRGYIDVCDGLGVRAFKVSHGKCSKTPPSHHKHRGSLSGTNDPQPPYNGSVYASSQEAATMSFGRTRSISGHGQFSTPGTPGFASRQAYFTTQPSPQQSSSEHQCVVDSTAYFIRDFDTQREVLIFGDVEPDSVSLSPRNHVVWQEAARKVAYGLLGAIFIECSYDDSQADAVLFGHLNPRHLIAELQTLAHFVIEAKTTRQLEKGVKKRKRSGPNGLDHFARQFNIDSDLHKRRSIAAGRSNVSLPHGPSRLPSTVMDQHMLDSQSSQSQFGGTGVSGGGGTASLLGGGLTAEPFDHYDFQTDPPRSPRSLGGGPPHPAPSATAAAATSDPTSTTAAAGAAPPAPLAQDLPLAGLRVVVIHVKDTLRDGPHVRDIILEQLQEHEQRLQDIGQALGCEFVISQSGESYYF